MKNLYIRSVTAFLLWLLCAGTSHALSMAYTDYTAFMAALPGPVTTLNFDSLAAGTTIASGDTVGGITFNYNFGGVQMLVTDMFSTISAPNFLGTDDGYLLQDGDNFNLSFALPTHAIGMFFITADPMLDNDIELTAGGFTAGLDASAGGTPLPDDGIPYFLGIIDDMTPFTTASITTIGGGFFLYNVDDITTAPVPVPGTMLLFATGLAGNALLVRRRSRRLKKKNLNT